MVGAGPWGRGAAIGLFSAMLLTACGGGNDGTEVTRSTVAVSGIVDDGGPTSPVANARCRALDLEGGALSQATANSAGEYLLLVEPGQQAYVECAPPGQDDLALRALITTEGLPEGGELGGQNVLPQTTVVARLLAQELADQSGLNVEARRDELYGQLDDDSADLALLGQAATRLFNQVQGGVNWDFEALFLDLVEDSQLDVTAFDEVAEALAAEIEALEQAFGRTLRQAYLATFPDFNLSLLHHADARSALFADDSDFGGLARFAALLADTRLQSQQFGVPVLVSAGNQIAPRLSLVPSLDTQDLFYDGLLLGELGYTVLALGPSDLALGPPVFADLVDALPESLPMVASTIEVGNEARLAQLGSEGRLQGNSVVEVAGRRIGFVTALRPDAGQVTSLRGLNIAADDQLVEAIQNQVDSVYQQGARIVVLLSQQTDLDADMALAETLSGVSLVVSGGAHLLAGQNATLIPGDEDAVAGVYPQYVQGDSGADIPVVATLGDFRYLGRLDATFDPLGVFQNIDTLNSGPRRVAAASLADGVMPDADIEAMLDPLRTEIEDLRQSVAATADVPLDATQASLRQAETNFGSLLADAVFVVARAQARNYGVAEANVGVLDAGSILSDRTIAGGDLTRAELFDLLDNDSLVATVPNMSVEGLKVLLESALAGAGGPAFVQLAGLEMVWDPDGTPRQLDAEGEVVDPGSRVRELRVIDGPALVENGELVEENRTINVATTDRLARGDWGHEVIGGLPVLVGQSLPLAVDLYLREALEDSRIDGQDYPEGGSGRIQTVD